MPENILLKLFEHNHWANMQIMAACADLSDAQLDHEPDSATKGSIRFTLWHLLDAQESYLSQLLGIEHRYKWPAIPPLAELAAALRLTGEGLNELARTAPSEALSETFQFDGYTIAPWVVLVQAINHATEHREQIKSMLTALGAAAPRIDGWYFGRLHGALLEIAA
ncbi:MAG: DinB family protein [Anaerolineales bacterium]|nr:DinB family protein [Anaerolineales bacterium]